MLRYVGATFRDHPTRGGSSGNRDVKIVRETVRLTLPAMTPDDAAPWALCSVIPWPCATTLQHSPASKSWSGSSGISRTTLTSGTAFGPLFSGTHGSASVTAVLPGRVGYSD